MLAWDIIKFLKQYGEPEIVVGDPQRSYDFFFDIINSGQVVLIQDDKGLGAAALYFKVRNLEEIITKRGTFQRMRNFKNGQIVYVHTVVIRPDLRKKNTIWQIIKQIRERELLCDKVAFTFNKNEKWTYKIERRRNKMRDNCGIIALDGLLKSLNMNMNRISLDTLSKICRDNGRLMFPLKVPVDKLEGLQFPYILQTNNHYEVIEDETALLGLDLGESAYLLYPSLNASTIPHVIDEEESKNVKGAGGGGLKGYYSKPARLLPMAVSAAAPMLGIGPTMGNMLGTGIGALQGGTTGLWGKNNVMGGAVQGFGQSLLGRGLGQGLNNWLTPSTPGGSLQGGPTFNEGFMSGIGQAMPFKNSINNMLGQQFYTPMDSTGVKVMAPGTPGAAAWQPIDSSKQSMPMNMQWGSPATLPDGTQGYFNPNNQSFSPLSTGSPYAGASAGAEAGGLAQAAPQQGFLKQIAPSAALMLGANLIPAPKYDVPNAADVYTDLINSGRIPQTSGPLGAAAQAATLKNINSPDQILSEQMDPYKAAISADLDAREQEELAFVRTVHAQNGTTGGSDEMRDINKVQEKYRNFRAEQLGAIEQNLYNQKVTIYLKSIADAYGMDQANLATLAGLTNTSISEAALKYGIKAQQVKDFRDAIYQLAVSVAPGANQTTAASLLGKLFAK